MKLNSITVKEASLAKIYIICHANKKTGEKTEEISSLALYNTETGHNFNRTNIKNIKPATR